MRAADLRPAVLAWIANFAAVVLMTSPLAADVWVEGFTEPYRQIELAAGEPGVVAQLAVQEGDRVTAGQVLGELDNAVLEAMLEIARERAVARGACQAAEAELLLRQTHLEQLGQLRDRGHATQREILRAETDLKVAQARLTMAEDELKMQRLECKRIEAQIARRQIRSPIDGIVSHVYQQIGESVLANDPRVVTVVQLDQLRAKFAVEPQDARSLQAGQLVRLELSAPPQVVEGTVEVVSPVRDAKSSTVQVTIQIDNRQANLASGSRCRLRIDSAETKQPGKATRYTSAKQRD